MDSPWQLYLFCAVQLLGFLMSSTLMGGFLLRDPCQAVYGGGKSCDDAEAVITNMNSLWLLSLAVFFFVLTFRNRDGAPEKLKRLAYFVIYCTIANLSGLLMIGSTSVVGMMKTREHVTYVIGSFLLFFILASAVSSDTPMVATAPFGENLGFNLKGYFALVAIFLLVWIFANSDFQPVNSVFQEGTELSELAKMCWNYWSVLALQVLFVMIYALAYDDDEDRETLAIATVGMNSIGMVFAWWLTAKTTRGIIVVIYSQCAILIALAIAAVVRYRHDIRRGGYETV